MNHGVAPKCNVSRRNGMTAERIPRYLAQLQARLQAAGGEYFADGRLTVADLKVFNLTRWLKSGALVVVNNQGWQTTGGPLRGCTQTVTIGFDAKHKASVLHVTGKKSKQY